MAATIYKAQTAITNPTKTITLYRGLNLDWLQERKIEQKDITKTNPKYNSMDTSHINSYESWVGYLASSLFETKKGVSPFTYDPQISYNKFAKWDEKPSEAAIMMKKRMKPSQIIRTADMLERLWNKKGSYDKILETGNRIGGLAIDAQATLRDYMSKYGDRFPKEQRDKINKRLDEIAHEAEVQILGTQFSISEFKAKNVLVTQQGNPHPAAPSDLRSVPKAAVHNTQTYIKSFQNNSSFGKPTNTGSVPTNYGSAMKMMGKASAPVKTNTMIKSMTDKIKSKTKGFAAADLAGLASAKKSADRPTLQMNAVKPDENPMKSKTWKTRKAKYGRHGAKK